MCETKFSNVKFPQSLREDAKVYSQICPIDLSNTPLSLQQIQSFLPNLENLNIIGLYLFLGNSTKNVDEELQYLRPFLPNLQKLVIAQNFLLDDDRDRDFTQLSKDSVIGACVNLTSLVLLDCVLLDSFTTLKQCTKLREVRLFNCSSLQNFHGLQILVELQFLDLRECNSLESFDDLPSLPNLKSLGVWGGDGLLYPPNMQLFHQLEELVLTNLHFNATLTLAGSTTLKTLYIRNSHMLQNIENLELCPALQEINVSGCHKITELNLNGLSKLQDLNINGCVSLQHISVKGRGSVVVHAVQGF